MIAHHPLCRLAFRESSCFRGAWILVLIGCPLVTDSRAAPPITAAAIAPDGNSVLLGSQSGIEIRNWPELVVVERLPTELSHVHDLRFSPDGKQLLAAGGVPAEQGEIELWAWPDRRRTRRMSIQEDVVYSVDWSADGQWWVTGGCGGGGGKAILFDAATAERKGDYPGHSRPVLAVRFLDPQTVVSAGVDNTLRIWSVPEAKHLRTLDNHLGAVNDLAFSPSANPKSEPILGSASEDRTVRLWQPRIGRLMRFARLASVPRCLVWAADGQHLIAGCNDGRLRFIDAQSMEIVRELDGGRGRIHQLILDARRERILVVGEQGCDGIALR
jgi:WD40 repeat protein